MVETSLDVMPGAPLRKVTPRLPRQPALAPDEWNQTKMPHCPIWIRSGVWLKGSDHGDQH